MWANAKFSCGALTKISRMRRLSHCICIVAVLVCFASFYGTASVADEAPVAATLTAEQRTILNDVENYLNGIQSLQARFVQIGPQGELSRGDLYLRRPGRLRFAYDPPSALLIVSDGILLNLYDAELEEVTRIPLSQTPLAMLVDETVRFSGKAVVRDVAQRGSKVHVTVIDSDRADEGAMTLIFNYPELALTRWQVHDAQGGTTDLTLTELQYNVPLSGELFFFKDPRRGPTND